MGNHLLRNLFDQYSQPENENRLTHALIHVLARNHHLTRDFIKKFVSGFVAPRDSPFSFSCQRLPGDEQEGPAEEDYAEDHGLPDAWIYNERMRWAVILECKVIAKLTAHQLGKHVSAARRQGFNEVHLLVITAHEKAPHAVEKRTRRLPCSFVSWPEVFKFFSTRSESDFESEFVDYMRVFEGKLMAKGYDGPPLTKFVGIPFSPKHPYNEPEAKVVLRALMAELRLRLATSRILPPIDEHAPKRPMSGTWDIVRFAFASGDQFTRHPHFAVGLSLGESDWSKLGSVWFQLVLPHNANAEYWKRVRSDAKEGLSTAFVDVAERISRHRVKHFIWEPKLTLELYQRHFFALKDWTRDGLLRFDLDTVLKGGHKIATGVKKVPAWLEAMSLILAQSRRANFELALRARFPMMDGSVCRTESFVDMLVKSAEAFNPFLALLRPEDVETNG